MSSSPDLELLTDSVCHVDHPLTAPSNAKVIGRNFIFMGLEVVITLVCTLLTTVVIARVIGPTRLGYFNLIFWLTSITCSVGSLGIPLTTFKYMGEFLGGGKKELARAVFFYNLWAQTVIACGANGHRHDCRFHYC